MWLNVCCTTAFAAVVFVWTAAVEAGGISGGASLGIGNIITTGGAVAVVTSHEGVVVVVVESMNVIKLLSNMV